MPLAYGELEGILDFQRFVRNQTARIVEEGMDKKAHLSYYQFQLTTNIQQG
jgi:hypothetical protein